MDFTSLYSTRIQSSFDDDQADIFRAFIENQTAKGGTKVSLINYFKGLPIVSTATVLGIDHGNLDLDVNPLQSVAISIDRYTLIRSKLFPFPLAARVLYVNIKKHMVSLNKLCYIEVLAEKRAAVRVELDPLLRATMLFDNQAVEGEMIDISLQGIAMDVKEFIPIESGSDLTIKFMLPDLALMKQALMHHQSLANHASTGQVESNLPSIKQTLIKVPATLVAIVGDGSPYRYKFRIKTEKHQEQLIARYSFHRQVEIIHGLKELID
ncbi:MAG: PilZ domain-containing protein [Desulfuromonadaceae bacterium]